MLSDKIREALNKQINAEMQSSYLYLSMAAHFEAQSLRGLAAWMRVQAQEETKHAMKLYNHVLERGGRVELGAIAAPSNAWPSALAVFEEVYQHECAVTGMIHHLVDLAAAAKDHAATAMLQWFVNEQVEEEASAGEILQKMKMVGDSAGGLLMLDHQLGKRGTQ